MKPLWLIVIDHLFFGDHVLDAELFGLVDDLRAALVAVLLLDLQQLFLDDLHLELLALQDRLQPLDQLDRLAVLVLDLLPFQAGEALEPHVQDGLRLDLGQLELLHQARSCAVSTSFDALISLMISSMLSRAMI